MIDQIAKWVVIMALAILGAVVTWSRIQKHGEEKAMRKQAERTRDAWKASATRRGQPLENANERGLSAAAELLRRGVRDD